MSEPEQQPSTSGPSVDSESAADDAPKLPAKLLAEAQTAFAMFSDGGGSRMNVKKLFTALRAIGVDATDEDVITVVTEHDAISREYITGDQWTATVTRRWAEDVAKRQRFRDKLAAGDPKSTGRVTVDHVLAVIKEFEPHWPAADVDDMVETMDPAGTGLIDYEEFMDTMVRPIPLD